MNRSAPEMAASIGVGPAQMDEQWRSLDGINLSSRLKDLGQEINISDLQWNKILAQAGLGLMGSLDSKIISLQNKAVEQATAIELRKMFGKPLSLLAMPVFVELEKIEVSSKVSLKEESISMSQLWEQINNRLLYMIQLFLAERINSLEEEKKSHEIAFKNSKAEAEGMPALTETSKEVSEQFDKKFKTLDKEKESLLDVFNKITRNVVGSIENVFETTVFSASSQNVSPTPIQWQIFIDPGPGFEPRIIDSESMVMPFHYPGG